MLPVKYGGQHLQHQQLMEDDGSSPSSVFSISNPHRQQQSVFYHPNYPPPLQQKQHHQNLQQHSSSVPITHQLFQHPHAHQFQPFQQQSDPVHHHHHVQQQPPFLAVNFKLGLNENSVKKDAAIALNHQHNDATFLHGNDQNVQENRRPQHQHHSLLMQHCWHPQDDSPIKEPFWKPLNRCEDRQCSGEVARDIEGSKYNKVLQQPGQCTSQRSKNVDNKYRHFGELEAIYGLAKGGETAQAGSGSALTGENSPTNVRLSIPLTELQAHNDNAGANVGGGNVATGVDRGSETSIGEEASIRKIQKKKKKNRKMKEQLSSMVGFFESLVKQVTDHQEGLHERFLEVVEKMDKERTAKEESWRRQEAEKRNRESIARAHEQALATSREAVIVSYLEKITGQSVNLPSSTLVQPESAIEPFNEIRPVKVDNSGRWPRAEVEALIQVRCNLESKFREPGLKGTLWEEISSSMASLGYQRSGKRCKQKWENINKYFRKSKENGKKRSQQSKTCTYFDQLDKLYSRIPIACPNTPRPLINCDIEMQQQSDSDFLEAYVPERDLWTPQVDANGSNKVSEMNSSKLDFDGAVGENVVVQGGNGKNNESHDNCLEEEGEREEDGNDTDLGE